MSIIDDFLSSHSDFARLGADEINSINNRPFIDSKLKEQNNIQAIATELSHFYDPCEVNTRDSLYIQWIIKGYKPSLSYVIHRFHCQVSIRMGKDIDFQECAQVIQILVNRLEYLFSYVKLQNIRVKSTDPTAEDIYWRFFMFHKNKYVYIPFIEAMLWFLNNDQYIKNICVPETFISYESDGTVKTHVTIKGIRVSMNQLQAITKLEKISFHPS